MGDRNAETHGLIAAAMLALITILVAAGRFWRSP